MPFRIPMKSVLDDMVSIERILIVGLMTPERSCILITELANLGQSNTSITCIYYVSRRSFLSRIIHTNWRKYKIYPEQGPVFQSIVSLMSSLRGQLVKCFTTL